jgi:cell division septation protein DedD
MPQGTRIRTTAPLRRLGAAGAALSLMALLAACGGQQAPQTTAHGGAVSHSGFYHRPASYAPPGPSHDPWGPWIRDASRRFDVPERWVREVMRQESAGRTGATSPVGAMGLMQVMPGTYAELRSRYGLGDDPYHPYDSIMAGTAYIREMYDLYGSPAFLAAYNAGPRRLEDYLWSSRGLPNETRNYVARIGPNIIDHHPSRRAAPEIYAAAEIPLNVPAGPRRMDTATMLALREQRNAQQPGIQVAQLPAGPVVRMEPIPDGSTYAAEYAPPVRVASLDAVPAPASPVLRMDPIPDGSTYPSRGTVVRMEPIPDGSTYSSRESIALPPPPAPAFASPVRQAAAEPARTTPPAASVSARTATVLANINQPPQQQPAGARRGFGLIGSAQASTLPSAPRPAAKEPATGAWAVQVGAFASENLARSAAATARGGAPAGRVAVSPVSQGRNTLYRARVVGLSQPAAQAVCEKVRGRGGCMVLSPNAQG